MQSSPTIEGIQVLRAVAAIMVVFHHARLSIPGSEGLPHWGASGVDIFFVISGFVMAYTTPVSVKASGAWLFLRKRVARIVPLYWLILCWTTRRDVPDINLLKDFIFIPHPNVQSPWSLTPIVIQGWTLNYEMFFYLLFSVALLFGSRRIIVLLFLVVLTFIVSHFFLGDGDAAHFYGNDIMFEFGFGVLLYQFLILPRWPRATYLVFTFAGFFLIALGYDREPRSIFEGMPALIIVWASFKACEGWIRWRGLALLGDSSYAIYLFHWASFGALKPFAPWIGQQNVAALMTVHVLTAIAAGIIIHLMIERRATTWAKRILGLSEHRQIQSN